MTHRHLRLAALLPSLAVLAGACAHSPPPRPAPFADSDAFHAVSGSVYGILEQDLDGDGLPDAVVIQQVGEGYSPAVYHRRVRDERTSFDRACVGPVVQGPDLEVLRFVELGGARLVLLLASEETPDELVQSFVLFDPADGCAARLKERVMLPKPADVVVGPGPVPAGVVVEPDGRGVGITDEPRTLLLRGAAGEVTLLASVRQRRVVGAVEALALEGRTVDLLAPRPLRARWHPDAGEALDLSELVDERASSGFALRPGEAGRLVLAAGQPFVALELLHGCAGQEEETALELTPTAAATRAPNDVPAAAATSTPGDVPEAATRGPGEKPAQAAYVTGKTPVEGSFVLASGRGLRGHAGLRRDFLLLREPVAELSVAVGPVQAERCVREIQAYGFR